MKRIIALCLVALASGASAEPITYRVDPQHTFPNIEFSHMGISVWRGKFNETSGEIVMDREARTGSVTVTVEMASINFGLDAMDEKARSADFFHVDKYPTGTYNGALRFDGETPVAIEGEITLLGVTRALNLVIDHFKCIPHPMTQETVCGANAVGELNWSEYGMKMSRFGEGQAGKVKLLIQVEAAEAHET